MGLSDFKKLREKLARVDEQLPTLMGNCVAENADTVADYIREQLEAGETPQATPIRPAYKNPDYARYKQAINSKPAYGTPDLKDKGNFTRSIQTDVYADGFENRATDSKTAMLGAKYGAVIGLQQRNILRLQKELLTPYLINSLRLRLTQ